MLRFLTFRLRLMCGVNSQKLGCKFRTALTSHRERFYIQGNSVVNGWWNTPYKFEDGIVPIVIASAPSLYIKVNVLCSDGLSYVVTYMIHGCDAVPSASIGDDIDKYLIEGWGVNASLPKLPTLHRLREVFQHVWV
jgi:hypothetical protein